MQRARYILWRILADLVSLLSRFLNAFLFKGSTAQTLSARSHLEARPARSGTGGAGSSTRSSSGSRTIAGGLGRRRSSARASSSNGYTAPAADPPGQGPRSSLPWPRHAGRG